MICPVCLATLEYKNRDYGSHGYYCTQTQGCKGFRRCDQGCCRKKRVEPSRSVDRRNPLQAPYPNMTWSNRHGMWVDQDTRSEETKARHEKIAAELEAHAKALTKPYHDMTQAERDEWNDGAAKLLEELRGRRHRPKWVPKVGDHVVILMDQWTAFGTIVAACKDDLSAHWIRLDNNPEVYYDSRDCDGLLENRLP